MNLKLVILIMLIMQLFGKRIWALVSLLVTIGFILVVSLRLLPLGVLGEWVWEYRQVPIGWTALCFPLIVFLLMLASAAYSFRNPPRDRIERAVWLFLLTLLSIGLKWVMNSTEAQDRQPAAVFSAYIVVSPIATTFFTEASEVERLGIRRFLKGYHERLRHKQVHSATHPPGVILFFTLTRWLVERFSAIKSLSIEALGGWQRAGMACSWARQELGVSVSSTELGAAWFSAQLMLLLGGLAILPVCLAALKLGAETQTQTETEQVNQWHMALISGLLLLTAPGGLLFLPVMDQVLMLLAAVGTLLVVRQQCPRTRTTSPSRWLNGIGIGLVISAASFVSFKFVPVALCLLLWMVMRDLPSKVEVSLRRCKRADEPSAAKSSFHRISLNLATALGSAIAVFSLLYIFFGFDLLSTFRVAADAHRMQTGAGVRTYWAWVLINPLDFALISMGPALACCLLIALWDMKTKRRLAPLLALLITITLLDISGTVRGEVARLWLPFLPIAAISAGTYLASQQRMNLTSLLILTSCQLLTALVLRGQVDFVRPW